MSPPPGVPDADPAARDAGPGGEVRIERLALRAAGLDEDAARVLARLVAEGLTPGLLRPASVAGLDGLDGLHVEVQAGADEPGNLDALARRIVDEIGRVLVRGPGGEVAG